VWANLACTVFIVGPATVAGLRRAGVALADRRSRPGVRLAVLVFAALAALLVADLSGMSKAETERIWLPFAMWLLAAGAFLNRPRVWLAAQAVLSTRSVSVGQDASFDQSQVVGAGEARPTHDRTGGHRTYAAASAADRLDSSIRAPRWRHDRQRRSGTDRAQGLPKRRKGARQMVMPSPRNKRHT
jgi:hypothetical protein